MDQASLLQRIAAAIADLPGVAAITLGGSTVAGFADASSDLDMYVFYQEPLAAAADRSLRLRPLADDGALADRLEALIDDLVRLIEADQ